MTSFSGRGRNYIPKPFKGLADRHSPNLIFHFSNESRSSFVELFAIVVSHSSSARTPYLISTTSQGLYKNKLTRSQKLKNKKNKKRGKIQYPPPPQCNTFVRHVPLALSQTLKQMETHARTHTLSYKNTHLHMHAQRNTRSQSLVEREGDANRGGFWTVAAISPPHPRPARPPQTTMNK